PESPATGRAAAPESTTADPEATVSARKRRRYPPARLWYRVNAQFHGEVDVPPGRVLELSEFEERWGLSSRTAIRLTLLCVDTREGEPEQPFAIKRRVRGKRRRVGGCPQNRAGRTPSGLVPTARFGAGAEGAVRAHTHTAKLPPDSDCPARTSFSTMLGSQGLTGAISSSSTATEGIRLQPAVDASLEGDPVRFRAPAIECTNVNTGNRYTVPEVITETPFSATHLFGGETYVDGKLVSESLRLPISPSSFGGRLSARGSVSQTADPNRPIAPAGPYFHDPVSTKDYSYRILFKPCPRRGRNVADC
ncbi:MAG: hypothetical protein WBC01_07000, partial [Solirubrobacterales bacterium]